MEEKRFSSISKEDVSVEDGKVVINSKELADAIQNESLDSTVAEEANGTVNIICF